MNGENPTTAQSKLLAIENHPVDIELMNQVIGLRPDIHLVTAKTGRTGLWLAAEILPDVILLDLHLPDMDGSEVLALLRTHSRLKDVPVVIVSANAFASQIKTMLDAGAFRFVTKPFDIREFLRTVDDALNMG